MENIIKFNSPQKLEDLPSGSLFIHKNSVCLKTEYKNNNGTIDAFIIGSGEMFWGGAKTSEEQAKIEVLPIEIDFKELLKISAKESIKNTLNSIPQNV